jgi:hypothetical protein
MARKVTRSIVRYDVSLQRRDGKRVAIIEAETADVYKDGRGYSGETISNRQVMVVPLMSLPDLAESIVRTLTFHADAAADNPEDSYDLKNDAEARIGMYSPLDFHTPVATFYTVAEARIALAPCASGYVLAHLPEEGEQFRNIIESKP